MRHMNEKAQRQALHHSSDTHQLQTTGQQNGNDWPSPMQTGGRECNSTVRAREGFHSLLRHLSPPSDGGWFAVQPDSHGSSRSGA